MELLRACGSWSQGPASPTWPPLLLVARLAPKIVILGSLLKLMNCLPEVNEGCLPTSTPASGRWKGLRVTFMNIGGYQGLLPG